MNMNEDFDLEIEDDDDDIVENQSPQTEPEDIEPQSKESDPESTEGDEEKPKRKRRARDTARYRINQLVGENKEKSEKLEKTRQELLEAKQLLLKQAAMQAKEGVGVFEGRISELESRVRKAISDGDEEARFIAERELSKAENERLERLRKAQEYEEAAKSYKEPAPAPTPAQQQQALQDTYETRQATEKWVSKNEWFQKLMRKAQNGDDDALDTLQHVTSVQDRLVRRRPESYFADPEGFYDTLTEILKEDEDVLRLMGDTPKKTPSTRTPGAGSPSAAGASPGKRKFKFTDAERNVARSLGLDLSDETIKKRYAVECLNRRKKG